MTAAPAAGLNPGVGRVGWVGVGHIGAPMAQRVRAAGFELAVWARRREAAAELLGAGAIWCDDPATLARSCDTVCTCVGGPDDVLGLHRTMMAAARPGTLFIDHSTAAPGTAGESARIASGVGVATLDAPVTGGVAGATRGTLTTFVGGDPAALARARPLLQAFSARIAPCGPHGAGYRVKLVNQTLMVGSLLAVADAAMLARAAGLDGPTLKDALAGGSGSSALFDSYFLRMMAPEGPASFSLGLLLKDLRLARDEALSLGSPTRLLDAALAAVDAACQRHGLDAGLQMLAA
jgi:3-hydroxyisobutyrate dehydrogenase-like beta-hydroxyacid dehydrogenase